LLGLTAVGVVQAANTVMGPFVIILAGTSKVVVPEIARIVRRSPHRLMLACLTFGGSLALMGLAWTSLLLVTLPRGLGHALLGDIWRPAYPLVPLVALTQIGVGLQFGAGAGLYALQAARRSLRAMLISCVLQLVLGVGGAILAGTDGTVLGTAVAAWLAVGVWWRELSADRRAQGISPAIQPPTGPVGAPPS
jgi:O-antigen/teichoic acid export membrane protein